MKVYILIAVVFFTSCSSNPKAIDMLKRKSFSYNKLSYSKYAQNKEAIVFIEKIAEKEYTISINSRHPDRDIHLEWCKNGNIKEIKNNSSFFWLQNYKVIFQKGKKRECRLSNNKIITF